MYTKEDILKFCFDLFDVDGSNTIDEKEFVELVKCVNNASPMFPETLGKQLQCLMLMMMDLSISTSLSKLTNDFH